MSWLSKWWRRIKESEEERIKRVYIREPLERIDLERLVDEELPNMPPDMREKVLLVLAHMRRKMIEVLTDWQL